MAYQEMEQEYYDALKLLNKLEDEHTNLYTDFKRRTDDLLDVVSRAFGSTDEGRRLQQQCIQELEENHDRYYRSFCDELDLLAEERQTQWRLFNQRVEELAAEAKKDQ